MIYQTWRDGYHVEKCDKKQGGLGCIYLHDVDKDNASDGRLGRDPHRPVRRRGVTLFCGYSLGPITGRVTMYAASAHPETVPGIVGGLRRTLESLPAPLCLRHSSI